MLFLLRKEVALSVINAIFDTVGTVISQFTSALSNVFGGVGSLFYTSGTNGATGELTILGMVTLIGVGVGVVYWAIRLITKSIKKA